MCGICREREKECVVYAEREGERVCGIQYVGRERDRGKEGHREGEIERQR